MDEHVQTENERSKKSRVTKTVIWGALILFLVFIGLGLIRTQRGPASEGEKAPDFTLTTFDGESYKLADYHGKVVVLNFWASWCKPCELEAAELEAAWQHYKDRNDVIFLGVDYVDTEPEAMAYLHKFNITFPNGPDTGTQISQAYRIRGVPETYIIDQKGIVVFTIKGPFRSTSQIINIIDPLLEP